MLLKIFKSKQPVALVFIILFTFLLWVNPFSASKIFVADLNNQMPLYALLTKYIILGTIFSKLIGFAILISIVLIITRLNVKYMFFPERSYLPSVFFITIVLGISNVHDLHPFLPALLLFLIAIDKLLETYKTDYLSYKIFDSCFIIGIASLFYFNTIFFILFIWIGLIILRPFYWREWIFSILGIVVPLFIAFSINYLCNIKNPNIISFFQNHPFSIVGLGFSKFQIYYLSIIFILILISSQFLLRTLGSKKIFTRKSYNLYLVLFITTIVLFLALKSTSIELIWFAALPLATLFSHYFLLANHTRWIELIFICYIIIFLATQFINF